MASFAFAGTLLFITPKYQATASMYVNNSSFSLGLERFSISASELSASNSLVNTYIFILKSRTTLEEVIAKAGLPAPDIEEIVDRVRVTIHVADHSAAPRPAGQDAYARSKDGRHVGRYDVGMLGAAVDGPVHRDVLLEAVGLKPLSQNYSRHVVPLLDAGLLAMTVPDKPRSKAQRYRITAAGREFLEAAK